MIAKWMRLAMGTLTLYLLTAINGSAVPFLTPLTFNELQIGEQALDYYNGGFGSRGTGPGPSFGISFTPDFVTVTGGVIFPDFGILQSESLTSPSGIMNISGGYSGLMSFYYTAGPGAGFELFSGLNGGSMAGSFISLPAVSIWTPASANAGPFQSIGFTGAGLAVDNITFGAAVIPEPVTTAFLLAGSFFLLGLAGLKRLRRGA